MKFKYWIGTIIFGCSTFLFFYGLFNQSWKDLFIGLGLMCFCYRSLRIVVVWHLYSKVSDKKNELLDLLLAIVGLISIIIAVAVF